MDLGECDDDKESGNDATMSQKHEREERPKLDQKDDGDGESDEEDEDAYRLRVYGSEPSTSTRRSSFSYSFERNPSGSLRRFSKRLSKRLSRTLIRRRSSIAESLPDTPQGWMVLSCITLSAILAHEVRLQKSLTKPPITFCQLPAGSFVEKIYKHLTEESPNDDANNTNKILSRRIQPSLFVGTRGMVSSTAAYLGHGPSSRTGYLRFREIFSMSQDGTRIAVDWEIQRQRQDKGRGDEHTQQSETQNTKQYILNGLIRQPVVLILHGINNDSSFGYIKSLSRTFCNRGYVSASMNFRGCGGEKLTSPRGYTAAYTGDLRSVVRQISARLDKNVPMFLVGNSLGANIMTKYLGEEGLFGTLPSCVSGAASLGNPLLIDSSIVKFPFSVLMALGVKKVFLENLKSIRGMKDSRSREILKNGFLAPTISTFDNAVAPGMIRNNPYFPFDTKVGYENGEAYWFDASSYRFVRHISVPFLNITAQDDFLVSRPSRNKLGFCLANPNVMIVETRCGGHLGWQETPPDSAFGASSWADTAASDFFDAIRKANDEPFSGSSPHENNNHPTVRSGAAYAEPVYPKMQLSQELKKVRSEALAFTKSKISRL